MLDVQSEAAASRPPTGTPGPESIRTRAEAVAAVAAAHASQVDVEARFPSESIAAVKAQRLLGIAVPSALGGEGASIGDVMDVCYRLGRSCASTGMVYAMHQIKVACILRHYRGNEWHAQALRKLCAEQLLLASSTTEGQGGGNVRASEAPVERTGSNIALERKATVISYGANADGIVTTARRAPDAPASDQVLVVLLKNDYTLERLSGWDTMGMRGTCSAGFKLRARALAEQILPDAYEKIHAQTMVPTAHLTWASVWTGVAAGAVERAQIFIRHSARQANGQLPPGAAHFTKASSTLRTLRGMLASAMRSYEQAAGDERTLGSLDFQTMITLTKVEASEMAVAIVMSALRACGLSGYRNDGDFSVSRALRDVLSSPIMINNDRILANVATPALMAAIPGTIRD